MNDDLFWEAARINQNIAKFIWIDKDQLNIDLPAYAAARGIDLDNAEKEIKEIISELLPDIEIKTVEGQYEKEK